MSLVTPTTQALSSGIVAQLEAHLSETIPLLPKSPLRVLSKVLSGSVVILYKYATFWALQKYVTYASMEETEIGGRRIRPLVELGRLFGEGDPLAARRAEIVIQVTVQTQEGELGEFSQLVRAETGVVYHTIEPVPLDAPTVPVTIRAVSDPDGNGGAGTIGNLEPGDVVSFANPIAKVARDATVVSVSVSGADAEEPETYRRRILRRLRARPQGGAYADYRTWALEVEGIAEAYPYTSDNPGEVDVYIEATEESSGNEDGIPTEAQLEAVYDNIQLDVNGKATRRPAGAAVNVLPISVLEFDLLITGLVPDTEDTRNAIRDGCDEYLRSREPFIVGLSVLPRTDRVTEAALGGLVNEIAAADGAAVTSVSLTPGPSTTLEHGQKARLGNVSFT